MWWHCDMSNWYVEFRFSYNKLAKLYVIRRYEAVYVHYANVHFEDYTLEKNTLEKYTLETFRKMYHRGQR